MSDYLTLHEMPGHLASIRSDDWNRLFRLIPVFESVTKEDVSYDHGWASIPRIEAKFHDFFNLVTDLKMIINFDWGFWAYEQRNICGETDLSKFSPLELCMMLTRIVRGDRFNQNNLIGCIVDGSISNILRGLQHYYG